jgi:hypothetical protein
MSRISQESLAGKSQSTHSQAGYECELPSTARDELLAGRRRPPIPPGLDPPITVAPKPGKRRAIYLALAALFCVSLLGPILNAWRRQDAPFHPRRIQASVAPQPTPQPPSLPTPTPGPSVNPWHQIRPAPRAVLVKLPPPKAQLIRLPEPPAPRAVRILHVGDQVPVIMPYGIEALATIKGYLPSTDQLPTAEITSGTSGLSARNESPGCGWLHQALLAQSGSIREVFVLPIVDNPPGAGIRELPIGRAQFVRLL